ncbi:hypothetical protein HUJ05_009603 [Dendroctonus ponderosae]|nr:hypothetical protein HUJ05_005182 [Dendroctonus ponderosae]KAH1002033.1 hypothetical protein HUJ05_009603 [Dendroctonus ponderosae]
MDLQTITYEKIINHAKFLNKALETGGKSGERHLAKKMILRIGTCNIQGFQQKNAMDVVALTESKKKGQDTKEKHGYIRIHSGVPKEERGHSGVSDGMQATE